MWEISTARDSLIKFIVQDLNSRVIFELQYSAEEDPPSIVVYENTCPFIYGHQLPLYTHRIILVHAKTSHRKRMHSVLNKQADVF